MLSVDEIREEANYEEIEEIEESQKEKRRSRRRRRRSESEKWREDSERELGQFLHIRKIKKKKENGNVRHPVFIDHLLKRKTPFAYISVQNEISKIASPVIRLR